MIKRALTRNGDIAEITGISEYLIFNEPCTIMYGKINGEEFHWNGKGRVKISDVLGLNTQDQNDLVQYEKIGDNVYYFDKKKLDQM